MKEMLEAGIRVFDLRPTFNDGEFWTYHRNFCDEFGCDGVKIKTFLEETKAFLDEYNELVILEISHWCNTNYDDIAFLDLLNNIFGNTIYKETSVQTETFINRPLKEILSGPKGKVVLKMQNVVENTTLGYFDYNYISRIGSYANKHILEDMKADQLLKFDVYNENANNIYMLSWTLTQNNNLAFSCLEEDKNPLSIQDITKSATKELANTIEDWKADNIITKTKIPNIISVDFANTIVTKECIKLSEYSLE